MSITTVGVDGLRRLFGVVEITHEDGFASDLDLVVGAQPDAGAGIDARRYLDLDLFGLWRDAFAVT